jgi:hypothetical protein
MAGSVTAAKVVKISADFICYCEQFLCGRLFNCSSR